MALPGCAAATAAGYELLCHTGDRRHATYVKSVGHATLWIEVTEEEDGDTHARLWSIYRAVNIGIQRLSFPHPRLAVFENQIVACIPKE